MNKLTAVLICLLTVNVIICFGNNDVSKDNIKHQISKIFITGNKVTKEYYINDYGNQIRSFVESVYFRIVEIKYKKKFPKKENLYPGLYIKDIANKILKENVDINFSNFDNNFETASFQTWL